MVRSPGETRYKFPRCPVSEITQHMFNSPSSVLKPYMLSPGEAELRLSAFDFLLGTGHIGNSLPDIDQNSKRKQLFKINHLVSVNGLYGLFRQSNQSNHVY